MAGIDIPVPALQATIHPPKVKEIAYMGEQKFFQAIQYVCLDKEDLIEDKTVLSNYSNFQVLMKVLSQTQDKEKKGVIQTLLLLLFPDYSALILPSSFILSKENAEPVVIDDNNFDIFQQVTRQILCVSSIFQGDNIVYNPSNDRAKEIANKLMKGRKKTAEIKAKSNQNNGSVLTRYLSILSVAGVAKLNELVEYNLFQLFDLMERYIAKVEWDTDLQARFAGGKPEKTVETWMREIHNQM